MAMSEQHAAAIREVAALREQQEKDKLQISRSRAERNTLLDRLEILTTQLAEANKKIEGGYTIQELSEQHRKQWQAAETRERKLREGLEKLEFRWQREDRKSPCRTVFNCADELQSLLQD